MKLQVSFDITNLEDALQIATQVAPYCDVLEVGTLLIYHYGLESIKKFKQNFPDKVILADTKIVDRGKQAAKLLSSADPDWLTVVAGTSKNVIHSTCTAAKGMGMKVMLDLLDTHALGQSAMEAKNLGVDALLFHEPSDEASSLVFLEKWDMVKGNTDLPIFISAKISRMNIEDIIKVRPDGIIIGTNIVEAEHPAQEAQFYYNLIKGL